MHKLSTKTIDFVQEQYNGLVKMHAIEVSKIKLANMSFEQNIGHAVLVAIRDGISASAEILKSQGIEITPFDMTAGCEQFEQRHFSLLLNSGIHQESTTCH